MDKRAVESIEGMAIAAHGNIIPDQLHGRITVMPNDFKSIDLEPFHRQRDRFRGVYVTSSVVDYASYVNTECEESPHQTFICADDMTAVSYINLGCKDHPGHGDWQAQVELERTPEYLAIQSLCNNAPHTQRDLIHFIEDWADCIQAIDQSGEPMKPEKAIAALRKITIESTSSTETEDGDFKGSKSRFDTVEAKSNIGLPAAFTFTCAPYKELPPHQFMIRLSIRTGGEKTAINVRMVKQQQHKQLMAEQFQKVIFEQLNDTGSVLIGTFNP